MPDQPIPGLWAGHSGLGDLCECQGCLLTRQQHAELEPRIFHAGDPEPTDITVLRGTPEPGEKPPYLVRGPHLGGGWIWTRSAHRSTIRGSSWHTQTRELVGTLTEVVTPDQGGLTGSSVIVEDVRPASQDRRGETITPSPVVRDAEKPSGELRASDPETELADLVIGVLNARTDIGTTPVPGLKDAEMLGTCSVIELSGDLVAAVLAAGWRPPVTTRVFRYVQPSRDPNVRPVYRAYTDGRITRQTTPDHDELDADDDTMGFLEVLVANGGMVEASE